jgi:hypothetical protein
MSSSYSKTPGQYIADLAIAKYEVDQSKFYDLRRYAILEQEWSLGKLFRNAPPRYALEKMTELIFQFTQLDEADHAHQVLLGVIRNDFILDTPKTYIFSYYVLDIERGRDLWTVLAADGFRAYQ